MSSNFLIVLQLVDVPEDLVTGPTDDVGKLFGVVAVVVVVQNHPEDDGGDGPHVGGLPGADPAHPAPRLGALRLGHGATDS